jgi:hypothetical protein
MNKEGKRKMRKESTTRLLLTLLIAFVMVAGVFGAAVNTSFIETADLPSAEVAVSEPDTKTRGMGDAPISALDGQMATAFGELAPEDASIVQAIPVENPEPLKPKDNTMATSVPETTGTRATGVEAGGPYGTESTPYIEGDSVTFDAETIPAGEEGDLYWRWDVNGDMVWDMDEFGGTKGITTYTHDFADNHIGQATVQAWDGVSMNYYSGGGDVWDGAGIYYYLSAGTYSTQGMKFTANKDCEIDQLGFYRYYYPTTIYNIRLWDDSGTMLAQVLYPSIPRYSWRWFSIPPVALSAGNDYIVSVGLYYYCTGNQNPGPTDDGYLDPQAWMYYYGSAWGFPGSQASTSIIPLTDVHYTYTYSEPAVLEDTAGVWVDNSNPLVFDVEAIGEPGLEGHDIGLTAKFFDLGMDDEWWYMWDYGDGTMSDWTYIPKFSGGVRTLFLHTYSGQIDDIMTRYNAALGPAAVLTEEYDCGPLGNNDAPDLDYMKQFDVVIIGSNYVPAAQVGNVLDDYCEAGGGVVELVATFYNGIFGVGGQWRSKGFSTFQLGGVGSGSSLSPIYDPTHPIIDGIAGTVSSYSCSLCISTYGVTTGATLLADYNTGIKAAAYRLENDIAPGTGRVAGINIFAQQGYYGGDAFMAIANAAFWVSQQALPEPLPMPISLPEQPHTYVDDHPPHLSHETTFYPTVWVKDDDHEKGFPLGGDILEEDFDGGFPPAGWYAEDFQQSNTNNAGGTAPEAILRWYQIDGSLARLESAPLDTTGAPEVKLSFKTMVDHYSSSYYLRVWSRADGGDSWTDVTPWSNPVSGNINAQTFEIDITHDMGSATQIRFEFSGYYFYLDYWYIDDFALDTQTYVYLEGIGSGDTSVLIQNVYPTAVVPPSLITLADELITIPFEGLEIYDPAMWQQTEEFAYRVDFDDGMVTDWVIKGKIAPPPLKLLLLHSWGSEMSGIVPQLQAEFEAQGFGPVLTMDDYNFGPTGSNTIPPLSLLLGYDVVVVSMNYYIFNTGMVNALGNILADYSDSGGGVIQMTFSAGSAYYSQVAGRWMAEDYNPISYAGNHYGYVSMGDVYDPAHLIMEGVEDFEAYYKHGTSGVTSGATRLADYTTGFTLCAYTNENHHAPGGGRIVGLNFFPWWQYTDGDGLPMMVNSIIWAWNTYIPTPVLDTFMHDFGDNGIYYVDLQFIDDDMWWDWSSGTPVFVGPAGEDPWDWISHNIVPISINNVDPEIVRPIRAYADADLSLRMSGNKHNSATMRLLENGVVVGETTVDRDPGAPDVGVFSARLEMTKGYDYTVEVEYNPDDLDGANPTWIFDTHWPDGKIKTLKHTFNSNDPTDRVWTIPDFETFFLGHDIIFEAPVYDPGSDDLAFVWNFGDSTPHGVHIYANVDSSTTVEGVSDEATILFNQLPVRDPWFDYMPNDMRSPQTNPIFVMDSISHVFDEGQPYYYYVTLIVTDDDVDDPYPSTQLHTSSGCDMAFAEIDFR